MNKKEKEEFYNKYVKDNRTEEEKIFDAIHENARKSKNDKIYETDTKSQKKHCLWLSSSIFVTDLIIIILLIILVVKLWA